jgi:hypothetical protein
MKGRKTIVMLALISALAISAVATSEASASGTTGFTCTAASGARDFADAHCTSQVGAGEGTFGHVALAGKKEITLSNEKTASGTTAAQPSILIGLLAGVEVEVICTKVTGSGTLTNSEVGGSMQATGTMTIEHSGCTVPRPSGCTVAEPIVYSANYTTYQTETEMGLKYTPVEEPNFGTFTLKNCTLANTYGIAGKMETTAAGTPLGQGATQTWTTSMSKLTWGGSSYTLAGAITLRVKGGDPIAFTT